MQHLQYIRFLRFVRLRGKYVLFVTLHAEPFLSYGSRELQAGLDGLRFSRCSGQLQLLSRNSKDPCSLRWISYFTQRPPQSRQERSERRRWRGPNARRISLDSESDRDPNSSKMGQATASEHVLITGRTTEQRQRVDPLAEGRPIVGTTRPSHSRSQ